MVAHKFSHPGAWVLVGCLAFTLGAGASQAFNMNWWPFKKKVQPPPQAVQVLGVQPAAGSAPVLKQFWERDTLVIDLQEAGSSGSAVLTPPEDGRWPARLSFRTLVGQFAVLEVRGAQRAVIPLRAEGSTPVTVPLDHTVWTQKTPQLELVWGAGFAAGS